MNDLNSVLLEGYCDGEPTFENGICRFKVLSTRREKLATNTLTMPIEVYNNLAVMCNQYLSAGRRFRVVGRLAQSDTGIVIVAEHIEYKPEVEGK